MSKFAQRVKAKLGCERSPSGLQHCAPNCCAASFCKQRFISLTQVQSCLPSQPQNPVRFADYCGVRNKWGWGPDNMGITLTVRAPPAMDGDMPMPSVSGQVTQVPLPGPALGGPTSSSEGHTLSTHLPTNTVSPCRAEREQNQPRPCMEATSPCVPHRGHPPPFHPGICSCAHPPTGGRSRLTSPPKLGLGWEFSSGWLYNRAKLSFLLSCGCENRKEINISKYYTRSFPCKVLGK